MEVSRIPVCGIRPRRGAAKGGAYGSRAGEHPDFRVEVVGVRRVRSWSEKGRKWSAEAREAGSVARSLERQQRREAASGALRAALRGGDDRARRTAHLQAEVQRLLDTSRVPWIRYEGDWAELRRALQGIARENANSTDPAGLGAVRRALQAAGLSMVEADEFARSATRAGVARASPDAPDDGAEAPLRAEEPWTSAAGAEVVWDEETVRRRRAEQRARHAEAEEARQRAREAAARQAQLSRLRWRQLALEAGAGIGAGLADDPRRCTLQWSRSLASAPEGRRATAAAAGAETPGFAFERAWARPDAVLPAGDACEAARRAADQGQLLCTQDPASAWVGPPRPFHPSPAVPDHLALHAIARADPALAAALCAQHRAALKQRAAALLRDAS
jgi:hypothetical protein